MYFLMRYTIERAVLTWTHGNVPNDVSKVRVQQAAFIEHVVFLNAPCIGRSTFPSCVESFDTISNSTYIPGNWYINRIICTHAAGVTVAPPPPVYLEPQAKAATKPAAAKPAAAKPTATKPAAAKPATPPKSEGLKARTTVGQVKKPAPAKVECPDVCYVALVGVGAGGGLLGCLALCLGRSFLFFRVMFFFLFFFAFAFCPVGELLSS